MLKIGLTGGIASGKSTVLDFFKKKDVPYIDADVVAREVVDLGTPGLAAIRELFGDTVILDDGRLNREALGSIVFHNEEKRLQLNSCLHGFIRQRIDELSAMYEEEEAPAVIYDIPLLIEGKWYERLDTVWTCLCIARGAGSPVNGAQWILEKGRISAYSKSNVIR